MPRLTGAAAKHYWIRYEGDEQVAAVPKQFKMQMSLRHIHWLVEILGDDGPLILAPDVDYEVASGVANIECRKLNLSNGTVRRTVKFPFPDHAYWTTPVGQLSGTTFALEGEAGVFHIAGRSGEKNSSGVANYNGE